jgi:hypothetical protein
VRAVYPVWREAVSRPAWFWVGTLGNRPARCAGRAETEAVGGDGCSFRDHAMPDVVRQPPDAFFRGDCSHALDRRRASPYSLVMMTFS